MNYVAAELRGITRLTQARAVTLSSEQFHLLGVQALVVLLAALLLHIAADCLLAAVPPHGVDVEPARPERPAPEQPLDRGHTAEDLLGRDALDFILTVRTICVGLSAGTDWIRKWT